MRVLLWPTYSYPGNVGADSLYLIARNLIRANPDMFWYVVVPAWKDKRVFDDLDSMKNVMKVPVEMAVLYRVQEAIPNADVIEHFAPQDGIWPVEAVVSMSPARTLSLRNHWTIRSTNTATPTFVNWDLLVRDDHAGEMSADQIELMQMAAGTWAGDMNVFESPIARDMTFDMCRKYLSRSATSSVLASSHLVYQGIPAERLLSITDGIEKRDRFTVYYGGRLSNSKRFDELATVVRTFYEFGRDADFVVTTGSLEAVKAQRLLKEFPFIELHVGESQEKAWEIMASCHTSLCFSSHELFGMAFWEQMAAGLPVVMKAERWNEELLPDGYPWIARTTREAAAYLRGQYEVWKQGHEFEEDFSGFVIDRYDSQKNLAHMGALIRRMVATDRLSAFASYGKGGRLGLADLVDAVTEGETEIGWDKLTDLIVQGSRIGKNVLGAKLKWAKSNAMLDLYRLMLWRGWVDTQDQEAPYFVKEADDAG